MMKSQLRAVDNKQPHARDNGGNKMDIKVKELWLAALRSGDYKQGRFQLCTVFPEGKFHCCLGVLEEVAVMHGVIENYRHASSLLDWETAEWAKLKRNPVVDKENYRSAIELNDAAQASFNEIADYIEANL